MDILAVMKANPPLSTGEAYWARLSQLTNTDPEALRSLARRAFNKEFGEHASIKNIFNRYGSSSTSEQQKVSYSGDSASYEYEGPDIIDTVEKALLKSGVDLNEWEVESQQFKTYTVTMKMKDKAGRHYPLTKTNYYASLKFKRKELGQSDLIEIFRAKLSDYYSSRVKPPVAPSNRSKTGVVMVGDFHFGADVKQILDTEDYNVDILRDKLHRIQAQVNEHGYSSVAVFMLGDFIESFTGVNHEGTWMELSSWGWDAVVGVSELLRDFLSGIQNLVYVGMVNGNHDRVTSSSKFDLKGEVGNMIAYLLSKQIDGVDIEHHELLLSKKIDGINYVVSHGNHKISNMTPSEVLFRHGDQSMYNVIAKAHLHSRSVQRVISSRKLNTSGKYKSVEVDEENYRSLVIPPLFTGNFWSVSSGYSGGSGFVMLEASGNGRINYFDYSV